MPVKRPVVLDFLVGAGAMRAKQEQKGVPLHDLVRERRQPEARAERDRGKEDVNRGLKPLEACLQRLSECKVLGMKRQECPQPGHPNSRGSILKGRNLSM